MDLGGFTPKQEWTRLRNVSTSDSLAKGEDYHMIALFTEEFHEHKYDPDPKNLTI